MSAAAARKRAEKEAMNIAAARERAARQAMSAMAADAAVRTEMSAEGTGETGDLSAALRSQDPAGEVEDRRQQ